MPVASLSRDSFLTSQPKPQSPASDDAANPEASVPGPIHDGGLVEYSLAESESILRPLIAAAGSGFVKIADPAVNAVQRLIALIQMLVIVFRRMEADSSTVPVQPIVVAELMDPVEKSDAENSMTQSVQGFITKIVQDIDGVLNPVAPSSLGE